MRPEKGQYFFPRWFRAGPNPDPVAAILQRKQLGVGHRSRDKLGMRERDIPVTGTPFCTVAVESYQPESISLSIQRSLRKPPLHVLSKPTPPNIQAVPAASWKNAVPHREPGKLPWLETPRVP